jgi:hypothetical protein
VWSTGAHLPVDKRSKDEMEKKRVPEGDSLHRKAWNQVKSDDNKSMVTLFVLEKIMQNIGIYGTEDLPQVSNDEGRDIFFLHNYSPCDISITMTYLLLGLVDHYTLKIPAIPRDRAHKTKKPKHSQDKIASVLKVREECVESLASINTIRSKYAEVLSIMLSDITRFYTQVNKVTDKDEGKSLTLFTQGRLDWFRQHASTRKKKLSRSNRISSEEQMAKSKKRAYAILNRMKYVDSEDSNDDGGDNNSDDESFESCNSMLM